MNLGAEKDFNCICIQVTSMAAILKAMENVLHIPLENRSKEVSPKQELY